MVVEGAQDTATLQIRTDADLLNWICQYVQQRGFTFTREVVADYYVSLKTKPFVILTGVSATGKTGPDPAGGERPLRSRRRSLPACPRVP